MKSKASFDWNADNIERCYRLFIIEGLSASQTGQILGVSRNAVCGIAFRKGWQRAETTKINAARANKAVTTVQRKLRHTRAAQASAPAKASALPPAVPVDVSNARPWEQREPGQCAWPIEVEGATFSCCAPVGHESPNWQYCKAHLNALQQPMTAAQKQKRERWVLRRVA